MVSVNEDGTAQLLVGAADLGTGASAVLAQITAEELGIPFDHVRVVSGDTDVTPYDIGAYASRTTYTRGRGQQARGTGQRATATDWLGRVRRLPAR